MLRDNNKIIFIKFLSCHPALRANKMTPRDGETSLWTTLRKPLHYINFDSVQIYIQHNFGNTKRQKQGTCSHNTG